MAVEKHTGLEDLPCGSLTTTCSIDSNSITTVILTGNIYWVLTRCQAISQVPEALKKSLWNRLKYLPPNHISILSFRFFISKVKVLKQRITPCSQLPHAFLRHFPKYSLIYHSSCPHVEFHGNSPEFTGNCPSGQLLTPWHLEVCKSISKTTAGWWSFTDVCLRRRRGVVILHNHQSSLSLLLKPLGSSRYTFSPLNTDSSPHLVVIYFS